MNLIHEQTIREKVKQGLLRACVILDEDVEEAIHAADRNESGPARIVLQNIMENLKRAKDRNIPMCQDTGMVVGIIRIGDDVKIEGNLRKAIYDGIEQAYEEGYFRKSVVGDPLKDRKNTGTNLPPVLHYDLVEGDKLEINLLSKGFGSENCSQIRMMKPTSTRQQVIDAVCEIIQTAGGAPCPPTVLGIGIGGTMDYAARLSKEALIRNLDDSHPDPWYADLEKDILAAVNNLGIGAGGLGGIISCLAVKIREFPTHIAGMPLAVTVNCWAERKVKICLPENLS